MSYNQTDLLALFPTGFAAATFGNTRHQEMQVIEKVIMSRYDMSLNLMVPGIGGLIEMHP